MSCTPWTLDEAKENLASWLAAERAVATGQSYRIGSRQLTRASLREITSRISFWRSEVARLSCGINARGGTRVIRVVPRDI